MDSQLRTISKRLRLAVIGVSALALAHITISFFVFGKLTINIGNNPLMYELWESSPELRNMLVLGQIPPLLFAAGLVFWVCRLFSYYADGEFFGDSSNRCYMWLLWLYGLALPVGWLSSLWISYLDYRVTDEFKVIVGLDIGKVFTLFVLFCIIYVLRTAKQIENENKEFV